MSKFFIALFAVTLTAPVAAAGTPVYVAAYESPPYFSSRMPEHIVGQLVVALNARQSEYVFHIRKIRASERYAALKAGGCCDLIFFEVPNWGWSNASDYHWGQKLTASTERYYVLKDELEAGKVSFNPLEVNRIGGVHSYHYKFTNNQTAPEKLEKNFSLYTADSPISILNMLVGKRIDIALFTDEFVSWMEHEGNTGVDALAGSEVGDHSFTTRVVVKKSSSLPFNYINNQLTELHEEGMLKEIFAQFGIAHILFEAANDS